MPPLESRALWKLPERFRRLEVWAESATQLRRNPAGFSSKELSEGDARAPVMSWPSAAPWLLPQALPGALVAALASSPPALTGDDG